MLIAVGWSLVSERGGKEEEEMKRKKKKRKKKKKRCEETLGTERR